jgi:hypothetical protein
MGLFSIWSNAPGFTVSSWVLHAIILVGLCAHAGYMTECRPFLGAWIAFMLNAHLVAQLKFKVRLIETYPD